ncbi:MAG: hypothetical protein AAF432_03070 [Planctomycetota bacterium]
MDMLIPGIQGILVDAAATKAMYASLPQPTIASDDLQAVNWRENRDAVIPASFRALLDRVGVPSDWPLMATAEHDVADTKRYDGMVFFVGQRDAKAPALPLELTGFEPLTVRLSDDLLMAPSAWNDTKALMIEFTAVVPWTVDIAANA